MKKILIIKILIALIIALSILAATFLILTPRRELYNYLYEAQQMELSTGVSAFEAELNYDGIIQQIIGEGEIVGLSTYDSGSDLEKDIFVWQQIYKWCKWICGIGVLLAVGGVILMKNQKWYECLNWAGWITIGMNIIATSMVLLVRPLRLLVLHSQYNVFIGSEPLLIQILPEGIALYTYLTGTIMVLIAGIVCILLYLGSRKSYKPHKF